MSEHIKQIVCSECNNSKPLMDHDTGELVCQNCGLVISSNQINRGPEWRAFDQEQRNKLPRVGAPITWTIHDKGLSTKICQRGTDASGRKLDPKSRARLCRLRKWNRRSKIEPNNRNLNYALDEICKISEKVNLPKNVKETSSIIYRQVLKKNLRGRTIQSIVVASIYIACRQCGIIRSLQDIANAANITKREAARTYRFLLKELRIDVPQVNRFRYISRIVNNHNLNGETEHIAKIILETANDKRLTNGRCPGGMAAACVYISCRFTGDRLSQKEIAKEAQVTDVTIRNIIKELNQNLEFELWV